LKKGIIRRVSRATGAHEKKKKKKIGTKEKEKTTKTIGTRTGLLCRKQVLDLGEIKKSDGEKKKLCLIGNLTKGGGRFEGELLWTFCTGRRCKTTYGRVKEFTLRGTL